MSRRPAASGRKSASLKLVVNKGNKDVIEEFQLAQSILERNGIHRSISELLTEAVRQYLATELKEITESDDFKKVLRASRIRIEKEEDKEEEKKPVDTKNMRLYLGEDEGWLALRLAEVVAIKKKQGVASSVNKEMLELIKAGFLESEYGSILRALLSVSSRSL